jgi:hypothetical protein
MSAPTQIALRLAVRFLQAAMTTQILLGLARFFAPFLGWNLPASVWRIHPVLGVGIAGAVLIVLRPRPRGVPTVSRRIARFAPLAPLALGLAIAFGLRLDAGLVALHMVVGITALSIVDRALKHLLATPTPAQQHVLSPQPRA